MSSSHDPHRPGCLDKICVLETASLRSGFAGRLLADMGAEVWKVEPPEGDPSRRCPPFLGGTTDRSLLFEFYDAGKRSVVIDSTKREDLERLLRVLRSADVWLDSS